MSDEKDLSTPVEGVSADDVYQGYPVFDVDKDSFFKNLRKENWNDMNFPEESKVKKFMSRSNHRSLFFTRYTDHNGEVFLKRIK